MRTLAGSREPGAAALQREAIRAAGPLIITGAAGAGITYCLLARAIRLVEEGVSPRAVLVLTSSPARAGAARADLHKALGSLAAEAPARQLEVVTAETLCEQLLRAHADEAGIDPFFVAATEAERVHMLLGHADAQARVAPGARSAVAAQPPPLTAVAMVRVLEQIDMLKRQPPLTGGHPPVVPGAQSADAGSDNAPVPFADLYADHERLLAERGALDACDLLLRTVSLLRESGHVRAQLAARYRAFIVDDFQRSNPLWCSLIELLGSIIGEYVLGGYSEQLAGVCERHPEVRTVSLPGSVRCTPATLLAAEAALVAEKSSDNAAGAVVAPAAAQRGNLAAQEATREVAFWQCADERAAAAVVAGDIERVARSEAGASVAVIVGSLDRDGRALVSELKERTIAYRVTGAGEVFEPAEVRDMVAWVRLLGDPLDTAACVRLLVRPPTQLRPPELARAIQVARRRKLDLVSALTPALQSTDLAPEARDRIAGFLDIYEELAGRLQQMHPQELVHALAERTGLRAGVLADLRSPRVGSSALEALAGLADIEDLAVHFAQFEPRSGGREFCAYLASAIAAGQPLHQTTDRELDLGLGDSGSGHLAGMPVHVTSVGPTAGRQFDHVYVFGTARPLYIAITRARIRVTVVRTAAGAANGAQGWSAGPVEAARVASGRQWEDRLPAALGETTALHAALRATRERVLQDVGAIGARLGELRLDTDRDIADGVARYLELVKLAALVERPRHQALLEALDDFNARLRGAATPLQAELFAASGLDASLTAAAPQDAPGGVRASSAPVGEDLRLAALLPRRGPGLVLSASDIETYRTCPLRYKFARVLRIPTEPTPQQRFGIMMHKVLERFHSGSESEGPPPRQPEPAGAPRSLATLLGLLDAGWRRAGFGGAPGELALLEKARAALTVYHAQLAGQPGQPVWFERSFTFAVGPHVIRGRVDRVDRLPDGDHELIDYKTGYPKAPSALESDIQLSLYALAAEQAWGIRATRQAYYYVLDNRKVALTRPLVEPPKHSITDTIDEVGRGIESMQLEPTPSYAACSTCDFLNICPAAEA